MAASDWLRANGEELSGALVWGTGSTARLRFLATTRIARRWRLPVRLRPMASLAIVRSGTGTDASPTATMRAIYATVDPDNGGGPIELARLADTDES